MSKHRTFVRVSSLFVCSWAVLALSACGSNGDNGGLSGVGGAAPGVGGSTPGNGGSVTQSGGSGNTAKGGTTAQGNGGTTAQANGGNTSQANGGSTAQGNGGAATNGGSTSTSKGGSTATNGGSSTASGGKASGGSSTASGGSSTASGGKASGGSSSTASGGKASGGTSAASGGATTAAGGSTSPAGSEVWVSPTGSDSNPGTKDSPMFNVCDATDATAPKGACSKLCPGGTNCVAGGTIWVMDGTYNYEVTQKTTQTYAGTSGNLLKIWAASGAKPVFKFSKLATDSTSRGLQIGGSYWHVKGITVTDAGDTGIFVMGIGNVVELCVAHHNRDAGIVIGVNSKQAGSGTNNLILNCDSYQNNDTATSGENADGFGMKENTGTGNIFRGCRAWDNADDGWDLYGWTSPVTMENCWAINQAQTTSGSESDGNGFKLGHSSSGSGAAHKLTNCYSTGNTNGSSHKGFTKNGNPATITCTKCYSWANGAADDVSGVTTSAPGSATAAKMIAAQRNADGSLPDPATL